MVIMEIKQGLANMQIEDLGIINKLTEEIKQAKTTEEANTRAAIITGYANAMANHRLITKKELQDILQETEDITVAQYQKIKMAEDLARIFRGSKLQRIIKVVRDVN